MNILTRLMRLQVGGGIHRDAHDPAVWERAVAIAEHLPHLEIAEFSITANSICPKIQSVIANEGREIDFPNSGEYTIEEIWLAQPEPRLKFDRFEVHIRKFSRFFPQLVKKRGTTLIFK